MLAPGINDMLAELAADPCNVLAIANTKSSDRSRDYCRRAGIAPHPARMPTRLVEFFIRFLTDSNDLVIGPFAGSKTTGAVAESLGRRRRLVEVEGSHIEASKARFQRSHPELSASAK